MRCHGQSILNDGQYAALDGRAGRVNGAPQLPNLLTPYGSRRPAWLVAGADYRNGLKTAKASLPSITTYNPPANVSLDTPNKLVRVAINAGDVTISGFNFADWTVYNSSAGTCTVDNSYFNGGGVVGRNDGVDISNNVTITNCEIDGTGIDANTYTGFIRPLGIGTFTFKWNYVHDVANHAVEFGGAGSACKYLSFYNLWQNFCYDPSSATVPPAGVHLNWWQDFGGELNTGSRRGFDTFVQGVGYVGGQGIQAAGTDNQQFNCTIITSNTGPGGTGSCVTRLIDPGHNGENYSGGLFRDFFIDRTGAQLSDGNGVFHQGTANPPNVINNRDLVTGALITYAD